MTERGVQYRDNGYHPLAHVKSGKEGETLPSSLLGSDPFFYCLSITMIWIRIESISIT